MEDSNLNYFQYPGSRRVTPQFPSAEPHPHPLEYPFENEKTIFPIRTGQSEDRERKSELTTILTTDTGTLFLMSYRLYGRIWDCINSNFVRWRLTEQCTLFNRQIQRHPVQKTVNDDFRENRLRWTFIDSLGRASTL